MNPAEPSCVHHLRERRDLWRILYGAATAIRFAPTVTAPLLARRFVGSARVRRPGKHWVIVFAARQAALDASTGATLGDVFIYSASSSFARVAACRALLQVGCRAAAEQVGIMRAAGYSSPDPSPFLRSVRARRRRQLLGFLAHRLRRLLSFCWKRGVRVPSALRCSICTSLRCHWRWTRADLAALSAWCGPSCCPRLSPRALLTAHHRRRCPPIRVARTAAAGSLRSARSLALR